MKRIDSSVLGIGGPRFAGIRWLSASLDIDRWGAPTWTSIIAACICTICISWIYARGTNDEVDVSLGVVGALFAIAAMYEAHRALLASTEVRDAIADFRFEFAHIIQALIDLMQYAESDVTLLIPTPAYGLLYTPTKAVSELFARQLKALMENPKVTLDLILIAGDLPARYVRLSHDEKNETYTATVKSLFDTFSRNSGSNSLSFLDTDPFVRIAIVDKQKPDRSKCLIAFVQETSAEKFRASSFTSSKREMVQAAIDLVSLYEKNLGAKKSPRPEAYWELRPKT